MNATIRASFDQNLKIFKISFFPPIDHCALVVFSIHVFGFLSLSIHHEKRAVIFNFCSEYITDSLHIAFLKKFASKKFSFHHSQLSRYRSSSFSLLSVSLVLPWWTVQCTLVQNETISFRKQKIQSLSKYGKVWQFSYLYTPVHSNHPMK